MYSGEVKKVTYIILIIGFALLIKGADYFVEGSSAIAKLLKIPSVIIGLTIVALGTSLPEAAVSITAATTGSNDLALSNIIGSNLFNLLIVVGVCALIKPFVAETTILSRDYPLTIALTGLLWVFARDLTITRVEGFILLAGLFSYVFYLVLSSLRSRSKLVVVKPEITPLKSIVFIVLGAAAIIYGGDLVVDSASQIAASFGLSQTLIGLTVIAIGTSLPELATSVVAAKKGESGLALGNVVGSNLFNILFILGSSIAISPIAVSKESITDILLLLAVTTLTYFFIRSDGKVTKRQGMSSILIYVAYTAYVIVR